MAETLMVVWFSGLERLYLLFILYVPKLGVILISLLTKPENPSAVRLSAFVLGTVGLMKVPSGCFVGFDGII